jgi:hypothetical protein
MINPRFARHPLAATSKSDDRGVVAAFQRPGAFGARSSLDYRFYLKIIKLLRQD